MKKTLTIIILLLLAVILSAGCIQEPETPETHLPPVIPDTPDAPPAPTFSSVEHYLSLLDEKYSLSLTEEDIQKYADELDSGYLKDAKRTEGGIWVDNLVEFQNEVTRVINLDPAIHNDIISQMTKPDVVIPDTSEDEQTEIKPKPNQPSTPMLPHAIISDVEAYIKNIAERNGISVTEEQITAAAEELKNGYLKGVDYNGEWYDVADEPGLREEILRVLGTI
ncbi:MAG TPA: hypothetical protein O0X48_01675 [Methanocorpusculum sp.]|nr:hypothetical protein [Methanocorpusculum sp.]